MVQAPRDSLNVKTNAHLHTHTCYKCAARMKIIETTNNLNIEPPTTVTLVVLMHVVVCIHKETMLSAMSECHCCVFYHNHSVHIWCGDNV